MNLTIENPPVTLRELSLNKLRNAIISGYFPAGKRLVERSLCEEMGVSRSVVREVIRYLEAEGLVETMTGKGPTVSSMSWEVAAQIYQIRLLLEQNAVAGCTANLTPQTALQIQDLLAEFKGAFDGDDVNAIIAVSSTLYEKIFSIAGQSVAWEVVQRLNGRISRLRAMTMKSTNRSNSGYQRIEKICRAICELRDPELARLAVHEHISEAAAVAQRILENEQEKS
ncbi:GntR family transcriptional regulator [Paraburkholderia sp. Ac-20340]|uniref:GntR family transcriptional regulator n=1 Tax=Paraburkholderia sp. Ac-20340 TaxID=2703888 RepID=UPI00198216DF|nr:GntR family transcriptional regulator [Paraburkholderia sp. Ac-20340]MBN3857121.1 GntR family transcriptional regulator [Paraburkholderia sp. Ac-20340]